MGKKKYDIAIFGRSGSNSAETEPAPKPCSVCQGDGRISVHNAKADTDEIRNCFGCNGRGW